jgi:hypothetical protein
MNNDTINLIGKWIILLACVATGIYCALTNRTEIAAPFLLGAFWFWFLAIN